MLRTTKAIIIIMATIAAVTGAMTCRAGSGQCAFACAFLITKTKIKTKKPTIQQQYHIIACICILNGIH